MKKLLIGFSAGIVLACGVLTVQAQNVGISNVAGFTPQNLLHVHNNTGTAVFQITNSTTGSALGAGSLIRLISDDLEFLHQEAAGNMLFNINDACSFVFNENSNNADFRIESDGNANIFFVNAVANNIGLGTNTPAASSLLDMTASGIGVLIPRMGLGSRPAAPANGLLYYQTDNTPGFYYFDGATWFRFATGNGAGWLTSGNDDITDETNFLGTTNAIDVDIRTSNTKRMTIEGTNGYVGIGVDAANEQLEISANFRLPATAAGPVGVIYSDANRYIHSFGGTSNFFAGVNAGNLTLTGTNNTGVGYQALLSLTLGVSNTALGNMAGDGITTGTGNVALGYNTVGSNSTTDGLIGIGYQALGSATGAGNLAIGYGAADGLTTGTNNIAIGTDALGSGGATTASGNTLIGYQAGDAITTGLSNVAVGYNAVGANQTATGLVGVGYNALAAATGAGNIAMGFAAGDNITTGNYNILIGYNVDAPAAATSDQLSIGNLIFATGGFGLGTTIGVGNVGIKTNGPLT
ncbi:MAG: hypothetical protein HY738_06685 [Bacteroidia bacterium]|nr:hypothetical protein [Bacteroidia bacterium]